MLQIQRLGKLTDKDHVWAENSSDAVYCQDESGREWIRKREIDTGCEPLLAEALGWLLARCLKVPVPEAAVQLNGERERSWLSRLIPGAMHWAPENYIYVRNLDGLGAMLTLDILILNEDRHRGNILLEPTQGDLLNVWTIDVGNALVGYPGEFERRSQDLPDARNLAQGLPFELMEAGAMEAALSATSLSGTEVGELVCHACEIAREPQVQLLQHLLHERCKLAPDLLVSYLAKIRA